MVLFDIEVDLLLRRNVFSLSFITDGNDHLPFIIEPLEKGCIKFSRDRVRGYDDIITLLLILKPVPDLLSDERHKGVQHFHQVFEKRYGPIVRLLIDSLAIFRLDHLQVPGAEFIPDQFIHSHQGI